VIGAWVVAGGDDFWRIAEQVLTDVYGRAPTAAEHRTYWAQLIDANRDRLVHPDDPGTIYRGQELEVIRPAAPTDQGGPIGDAPLTGTAPTASIVDGPIGT
jgi:hypothetical protein